MNQAIGKKILKSEYRIGAICSLELESGNNEISVINLIDCESFVDTGIVGEIITKIDSSNLGLKFRIILEKEGKNIEEYKQFYLQVSNGKEFVALIKKVTLGTDINEFNPISEDKWS